jgi:hypothetical protein
VPKSKNDVTVIVRNYISHKFLIVLVQNVWSESGSVSSCSTVCTW